MLVCASRCHIVGQRPHADQQCNWETRGVPYKAQTIANIGLFSCGAVVVVKHTIDQANRQVIRLRYCIRSGVRKVGI